MSTQLPVEVGDRLRRLPVGRRRRRCRRVHRASGLPVKVSNVPRPVLVLVAEIDARRLDGVAQCRRLLRRGAIGVAGHGFEFDRFFVFGFGHGDRLIGHPARRPVVYEEFDDIRFSGDEGRQQGADLLALNLGFDGGLHGIGPLLGLRVQLRKLRALALGVTSRRSSRHPWRPAGPSRPAALRSARRPSWRTAGPSRRA